MITPNQVVDIQNKNRKDFYSEENINKLYTNYLIEIENDLLGFINENYDARSYTRRIVGYSKPSFEALKRAISRFEEVGFKCSVGVMGQGSAFVLTCYTISWDKRTFWQKIKDSFKNDKE